MGLGDEALAQIAPAVQSYDANGMPNDPDRLWAISLLGRARLETGDIDGAGRALREAVETDGLFPEHKLYVPIIHSSYARWLKATGDATGAKAELGTALDQARSVYGQDHSLVKEITALAAE
jgi:cytochrome c-type biogenesis protein CcmH/NrfG